MSIGNAVMNCIGGVPQIGKIHNNHKFHINPRYLLIHFWSSGEDCCYQAMNVFITLNFFNKDLLSIILSADLFLDPGITFVAVQKNQP